MITLDWDNITLKDSLKLILKIQSDSLSSSILLSLSPMKHGYHVYVTSYYHLSTKRILKLRNIWHDDKARLLADWENLGQVYRNVMFNFKVKNGEKYYEEPLYLYQRIKEGYSDWSTKRLVGLSSPSQLSSPSYYARVVS